MGRGGCRFYIAPQFLPGEERQRSGGDQRRLPQWRKRELRAVVERQGISLLMSYAIELALHDRYKSMEDMRISLNCHGTIVCSSIPY